MVNADVGVRDGKIARVGKLDSVRSAIRSMTSLPAQILGLRDRGVE